MLVQELFILEQFATKMKRSPGSPVSIDQVVRLHPLLGAFIDNQNPARITQCQILSFTALVIDSSKRYTGISDVHKHSFPFSGSWMSPPK
mmetsp:Transcript_33060/g.38286  ORF Transcript_33060/g.38286 Transcript_33060/m.38286 type:complete len:90 (+) Transcript_33060:274-543(+)